MTALSIVYQRVGELKKYKNNSRTHSEKQIKQIERSITEFGFTNPILVDQNSEIIAGHGRLEAAKNLKLEMVPTITLEGLTEEQKKAYVIADNKLALNAEWDIDFLRKEVDILDGLNFDLDLLGLNTADYELLYGKQKEDFDIPDDFQEIGEQELAHKCPKCGYEFD